MPLARCIKCGVNPRRVIKDTTGRLCKRCHAEDAKARRALAKVRYAKEHRRLQRRLLRLLAKFRQQYGIDR